MCWPCQYRPYFLKSLLSTLRGPWYSHTHAHRHADTRAQISARAAIKQAINVAEGYRYILAPQQELTGFEAHRAYLVIVTMCSFVDEIRNER
jgi:hypothetical protein